MPEGMKPCPFCGGKAELKMHEAYSTDSSFGYLGCSGCSIMLPVDESFVLDEVTLREWNTRHTERESGNLAAKIFREGLARFQREFWDSYYFPPQGQFNIKEMQRLDAIIMEALIEGDEANNA